MAQAKTVTAVHRDPPRHWVGDGFPVRSVFSPSTVADALSPFVLFDYAGPQSFAPAAQPRGVGPHPHRGFATVTVVYQGEVAHRDTAGNQGTIGPGDVQWMTAGRGVLHEELHSAAFTARGGELEMAQLWVNLPARHKLTTPDYQDLRAAAIPVVAEGGARVRLIAGDWHGQAGAARTFTAVRLWDAALDAGAAVELPLPDGETAAVFVRRGAVELGGRAVAAGELAVLSTAGAGVRLAAAAPAELLVLGGAPLGEPVVAYGPFVMNTVEEIRTAVADLQAGRFGEL